MDGQYLCNQPITVSYAFKKDGKGERHGSAAGKTTGLLFWISTLDGSLNSSQYMHFADFIFSERLLAAQSKRSVGNIGPSALPNQFYANVGL